jgi:hypothetical protein
MMFTSMAHKRQAFFVGRQNKAKYGSMALELLNYIRNGYNGLRTALKSNGLHARKDNSGARG